MTGSKALSSSPDVDVPYGSCTRGALSRHIDLTLRPCEVDVIPDVCAIHERETHTNHQFSENGGVTAQTARGVLRSSCGLTSRHQKCVRKSISVGSAHFKWMIA